MERPFRGSLFRRRPEDIAGAVEDTSIVRTRFCKSNGNQRNSLTGFNKQSKKKHYIFHRIRIPADPSKTPEPFPCIPITPQIGSFQTESSISSPQASSRATPPSDTAGTHTKTALRAPRFPPFPRPPSLSPLSPRFSPAPAARHNTHWPQSRPSAPCTSPRAARPPGHCPAGKTWRGTSRSRSWDRRRRSASKSADNRGP